MADWYPAIFPLRFPFRFIEFTRHCHIKGRKKATSNLSISTSSAANLETAETNVATLSVGLSETAQLKKKTSTGAKLISTICEG
jgi:glycine cleavage system pyridoxal-binding protein P